MSNRYEGCFLQGYFFFLTWSSFLSLRPSQPATATRDEELSTWPTMTRRTDVIIINIVSPLLALISAGFIILDLLFIYNSSCISWEMVDLFTCLNLELCWWEFGKHCNICVLIFRLFSFSHTMQEWGYISSDSTNLKYAQHYNNTIWSYYEGLLSWLQLLRKYWKKINRLKMENTRYLQL